MTKTLHVYEAISAITRDLSKIGVAKAKKNQQQGWAFRGIDDMYNAVAPLLARHELVMLPVVKNRTVTERPTKSGGAIIYAILEIDYNLVSARDGSTATVTIIGEASDTGDKSTNKAMSAAYKYLCLQLFCIPTEGQEDADYSTVEFAAPKVMSEQDIKVLEGLVESTGGAVAPWRKWMKTKYPNGLMEADFAEAEALIMSASEKRKQVAG